MAKRRKVLGSSSNGRRPDKPAVQAFFDDLRVRLGVLDDEQRDELLKAGDEALSRVRASGARKASRGQPRAQASGR
jgi:hypothetical protein